LQGYFLESLLKNNEGKLLNDVMYRVILEKDATASFKKILENKRQEIS
jgi:hypothetical protein